MDDKLNIFEVEALLTFLKDYVNRKNISIYEGTMPRHLLLAIVKLQKYKDAWEESMKYTE